ELHPLKRAIDSAGQSLSERGLADSRDSFDEQVSAGEDADQREADNIVLTANHAAQSFFQFDSLGRHSDGDLGRHSFDSTIGCRRRRSYRRHETSCQLSAVSFQQEPLRIRMSIKSAHSEERHSVLY